MWLWLRWRFRRLGTFWSSPIWVNSFSSKDIRVILFRGTFSLPFRVTPLSRIASVMGF